MVPKKKVTSASGRSSSSVVLTKGDWLDVMDLDGVWNVARVLSVPSSEEVEVMYDGWPEDYDEVVRVDSDRVAPFHTFTWAVKCWVKYLNWPMWPSVITIRTPGTAEGVQNLAMENRFYVDFLDDPAFAKRDRCWQTKRQVKLFDVNYDQNRMGTNGAQFERALECVLKSDATTKLPKFAKGTLPLQYETLTTESVEAMRKNMGTGLWYRNFANNKERHKHTHIYDVVGDEDDDVGSDNSAPIEKLRVKRPRTSTTSDNHITSNSQKHKKRPIPTDKQQVYVKIEPESIEPIESSGSDCEKELVSTKKRRRVQENPRPNTVPMIDTTGLKTKKRVASPDRNIASAMPRHVTVAMDEIIVDDDSDSSSVVWKKRTRKKRTLTARKAFVKKNPPRLKEESEECDNSVSLSEPEFVPLRSDLKSPRTRQRVRRRKSEEAATLHRNAWDGMFGGFTPLSKKKDLHNSSDDESDGSGYSDSFDPGTTSEDKAESSFDSRMNFQETEASRADAKSTRHVKMETGTGSLETTTKAQSPDKGTRSTRNELSKMAARRSIPHRSEGLSLIAHAKPRRNRSGNVIIDKDSDDSEEEEKIVPNTARNSPVRVELAPKKSVSRQDCQQLEKSQQDREDVAALMKSSLSKSPKRSKAPVSFIDKRIAAAQEAIRQDKAKFQTTENSSRPDQQKQPSRAASKSNARSRSSSSQSDVKDSSQYKGEASDGPSANSGHRVAMVSGDHKSHSFLSVNEAYNCDRQESNAVSTPFDIDIRADSKEIPRVDKADAKARNSGDLKQDVEEIYEAKETQELRREFSMMRPGSEESLEMEGGQVIETFKMKNTVSFSVPRKFNEPAKEARNAPDFQLQSPSSKPFSSSDGFSMEKWLEHSLIPSVKRTEI